MLNASTKLSARRFIRNYVKPSGLNEFISGPESSGLEGLQDNVKKAQSGTGLLKAPPGLPGGVAVKDNIATSGFPLTCASGVLRDYQSPKEAEVVRRLRHCDSFVVGKTNMDEFGMGSHSTNSFFGPVQNISSLAGRSAGGSSGGSAVAVVTEQCQVALGTDTGGSVRLPAAYTGVVGFKPSYGMISRRGVVPYANSLDTVGIIARSAKDIFAAFYYTRYHDNKDETSISELTYHHMKRKRMKFAIQSGRKDDFNHDFKALRIGVPMEYNISELEPAVREAWEDALKAFQDQGCSIVPVSLPNTKHALSAYYVLAPAEAASNLAKYDGVRYGFRSEGSDGAGDVLYSKTRGEGFGDEVKRRILLGSYTLSSTAIDNYFIKAQKVRRLIQRDFDHVFSLPNLLRPAEQFDLSKMDENIELQNKLGPAQVDFILCPTAPTLPPKLENVCKQAPVDTYMNDVFTVPASLAGLPAISVPWKIKNKSGEKTNQSAGIQIIGQYSDDFRLILTAMSLEQMHRGESPVLQEWMPKRRLGDKYRFIKTIPKSRKITKHYSGLYCPELKVEVDGDGKRRV